MRHETIEQYLARGGQIRMIAVQDDQEQSPTAQCPDSTQRPRSSDCRRCEQRDNCQLPGEYHHLCAMLQEYLARTVEIRQRERTIEETDRRCPRPYGDVIADVLASRQAVHMIEIRDIIDYRVRAIAAMLDAHIPIATISRLLHIHRSSIYRQVRHSKSGVSSTISNTYATPRAPR